MQTQPQIFFRKLRFLNTGTTVTTQFNWVATVNEKTILNTSFRKFGTSDWMEELWHARTTPWWVQIHVRNQSVWDTSPHGTRHSHVKDYTFTNKVQADGKRTPFEKTYIEPQTIKTKNTNLDPWASQWLEHVIRIAHSVSLFRLLCIQMGSWPPTVINHTSQNSFAPSSFPTTPLWHFLPETLKSSHKWPQLCLASTNLQDLSTKTIVSTSYHFSMQNKPKYIPDK